MSDTNNTIPELILESTPAADAAPQLVLEPTPAPAAPLAEVKKEEAPAVKMDEDLLSPAEKKAVEEFSQKIDIRDSNLVLQYGAAAQKSVAAFSENALSSVRNKDLGEIGETLSHLVAEVKGFGDRKSVV